MLINHLKLAFRHLLGAKGYAVVNLLGLSIGIICCLMLFQYVGRETSFDTFNKNADNIVRMRMAVYEKGKLSQESATVQPPAGAAMKKDFPEVEDYCRLMAARVRLSNPGRDVESSETAGFYADQSFLHIFTLPFVEGDPASALDGPNKMIISEDMARKYFGTANPIGRRLRASGQPAYYYPIWTYGQTESFEVTGVFRNYPGNAHLSIDYLISYPTFVGLVAKAGGVKWKNAADQSWGWYDMWTYLLLRPGTNLPGLNARLSAFGDRHINQLRGVKNSHMRYEYHLIPLRDIHLNSHDVEEAGANGSASSVYFLLLIGILIVGIAWVNYTNLATARSLERSREVGVRKVLGASRGDLVRQFLMESFVMNGIALAVAILACYALAPLFNRLTGSLADGFQLRGQWLTNFIVLFAAGAFLSGVYPAFVLSGFHPIVVLRGLFKHTPTGLWLRKALIVGQFTASVLLIAGTIIVYQQVTYMRNQQLGMDIRQTLVLDGDRSFSDSVYRTAYQSFKNDLLQVKGVSTVTASSEVMGHEIAFGDGVALEEKQAPSYLMSYNLVDYDFVPAFGLRLLAGRNFSPGFGRDTKGIILNESAARTLGFSSPEKALHQYLRAMDDSVEVVGVVADYHQEGLQKSIDPMVFRLAPWVRDYYSLKLRTGSAGRTVADVKAVWKRHFPADAFNYFFLDDYFNQQYKADSTFGKVFSLFAFLAILIACFGLLGLSAYNVVQRTKEVGIRKVLGASVRQLLFLLSRDFVILVGIAIVLATPLTWWIMHRWLQDFAYRIGVAWWVFAVAGMLAIGIAILTVAAQAWKAAVANPVKSLRTE